MIDLLKMILSLSLSGTLLIIIFFLCKPLWKNKFSKQWQYYIWLIVIVRLLIPIAPEANLMGTIFQEIEQNIEQSNLTQPAELNRKIISGSHDSTLTQSDTYTEPATTTKPSAINDTVPVPLVIFLIWLCVALVLFVRKITIYQSFVNYIKASQEPIDNIDILNRFETLVSEADIKRNIELTTNPLISSPFFSGFIHPCVVLPDTAVTDADFYYTVLHELTHYKRHDMLYKWLVQLTICVHWFNPIVYLMGQEINRACELSCDESVIHNMDGKEKAAYGDTLLNAMEPRGHFNNSLASVTLNENKLQIKERLDAIMNFKKKSKRTIAITIILTALICTGAMSAGVYASPKGGTSSEWHAESRTESLLRVMEPFRVYGLIYDAQQDEVFYNGELVKAFVDLREVYPNNSYSFNVGYFSDNADSDLYLESVHDENGNVIGIETMSEELRETFADINEDSNNDWEKPSTDLEAQIEAIRDQMKDAEEELYDLYDEYNASMPNPSPELKDQINELKNKISDLKEELKDNMSDFNKELENDLAGLDEELEKVKNDWDGFESDTSHGKYVTFDATTNIGDNITATDKFSLYSIPREVSNWIADVQGSQVVNVKSVITNGKIDAWIYYDQAGRLAWNVDDIGTNLRFTLIDLDEPLDGATLIHYQAPASYQGLEVIYNNESLPINVK